MADLRYHRTPHWLNARTRIGPLTIPQWIAVGLAFAIGGLLYWVLTTIHAPAGLGALFLFGRIVVAGVIAGALAALFYGLVDDRREPFIRQLVTYPFRSHAYLFSRQSQEETDAHRLPIASNPRNRRPFAVARRLAARWHLPKAPRA